MSSPPRAVPLWEQLDSGSWESQRDPMERIWEAVAAETDRKKDGEGEMEVASVAEPEEKELKERMENFEYSSDDSEGSERKGSPVEFSVLTEQLEQWDFFSWATEFASGALKSWDRELVRKLCVTHKLPNMAFAVGLHATGRISQQRLLKGLKTTREQRKELQILQTVFKKTFRSSEGRKKNAENFRRLSKIMKRLGPTKKIKHSATFCGRQWTAVGPALVNLLDCFDAPYIAKLGSLCSTFSHYSKLNQLWKRRVLHQFPVEKQLYEEGMTKADGPYFWWNRYRQNQLIESYNFRINFGPHAIVRRLNEDMPSFVGTGHSIDFSNRDLFVRDENYQRISDGYDDEDDDIKYCVPPLDRFEMTFGFDVDHSHLTTYREDVLAARLEEEKHAVHAWQYSHIDLMPSYGSIPKVIPPNSVLGRRPKAKYRPGRFVVRVPSGMYRVVLTVGKRTRYALVNGVHFISNLNVGREADLVGEFPDAICVGGIVYAGDSIIVTHDGRGLTRSCCMPLMGLTVTDMRLLQLSRCGNRLPVLEYEVRQELLEERIAQYSVLRKKVENKFQMLAEENAKSQQEMTAANHHLRLRNAQKIRRTRITMKRETVDMRNAITAAKEELKSAELDVQQIPILEQTIADLKKRIAVREKKYETAVGELKQDEARLLADIAKHNAEAARAFVRGQSIARSYATTIKKLALWRDNGPVFARKWINRARTGYRIICEDFLGVKARGNAVFFKESSADLEDWEEALLPENALKTSNPDEESEVPKKDDDEW